MAQSKQEKAIAIVRKEIARIEFEKKKRKADILANNKRGLKKYQKEHVLIGGEILKKSDLEFPIKNKFGLGGRVINNPKFALGDKVIINKDGKDVKGQIIGGTGEQPIVTFDNGNGQNFVVSPDDIKRKILSAKLRRESR